MIPPVAISDIKLPMRIDGVGVAFRLRTPGAVRIALVVVAIPVALRAETLLHWSIA